MANDSEYGDYQHYDQHESSRIVHKFALAHFKAMIRGRVVRAMCEAGMEPTERYIDHFAGRIERGTQICLDLNGKPSLRFFGGCSPELAVQGYLAANGDPRFEPGYSLIHGRVIPPKETEDE